LLHHGQFQEKGGQDQGNVAGKGDKRRSEALGEHLQIGSEARKKRLTRRAVVKGKTEKSSADYELTQKSLIARKFRKDP